MLFTDINLYIYTFRLRLHYIFELLNYCDGKIKRVRGRKREMEKYEHRGVALLVKVVCR